MIIVVATIRVHPGKAEEYEAFSKGLMAKVREANPGILFYHAGKCREEPDTYRVIEAYEDQAAMDKHAASDLLRDALATFGDFVADAEIKLHDGVA